MAEKEIRSKTIEAMTIRFTVEFILKFIGVPGAEARVTPSGYSERHSREAYVPKGTSGNNTELDNTTTQGCMLTENQAELDFLANTSTFIVHL